MKYVTFIVCCLVALPATAQDWPDLLGVWKGTSRSVVLGEGGHFTNADIDDAKFLETELTIEWVEQDNGRLVGSITSALHKEPKLGILSSDGESIFTVDTDGYSSGRLIETNQFELCYMQTAKTETQMIASCVIFERQT